jgi:hypothetical protein
MDDVIHLLLSQMSERGIVAVAPVLADDVANFQLGEIGIVRGQRLELASPAHHLVVEEAVEVIRVGLERAVRNRELDRVVGAGRDGGDDLGK